MLDHRHHRPASLSLHVQYALAWFFRAREHAAMAAMVEQSSELPLTSL
jgi:hypothetical protein